MAIRPRCDGCHEKLRQFGGLFFRATPREGRYEKRHLCVEHGCYGRARRQVRRFGPNRCCICGAWLRGRVSYLLSPPTNAPDTVDLFSVCSACDDYVIVATGR
jgi:hypothetical protein